MFDCRIAVNEISNTQDKTMEDILSLQKDEENYALFNRNIKRYPHFHPSPSILTFQFSLDQPVL